MILVDTNVVSELLRVSPDRGVVDWLRRQSPLTLHISSVTLAELLTGVAVLEDGRRKDALGLAVRETVAAMFDDRVLPFDAPAAEAFAALTAATRQAGRTVSFADGQIAATALAHGYDVATRDVDPFVAAGVRVIDPWS